MGSHAPSFSREAALGMMGTGLHGSGTKLGLSEVCKRKWIWLWPLASPLLQTESGSLSFGTIGPPRDDADFHWLISYMCIRTDADVPVALCGMVSGNWALNCFCSKSTRVGLIDLGDSIGLPDRCALKGFDGACFIEVKNHIELL